MKYFLDSAKLDEIDYAYKYLKIDGVTTNPRHIMNSGKPFLTAITDIANWIKENHLEGKDEIDCYAALFRTFGFSICCGGC